MIYLKLHFKNFRIKDGESKIAKKNFEFQPIHAKLCEMGLMLTDYGFEVII